MFLYKAVVFAYLTAVLYAQTNIDRCIYIEDICPCNLRDGLYIVDCNSQSIVRVIQTIRAANITGNVRELTILGASETVLHKNIFNGFTNLKALTIEFAPIMAIIPGAFNSLSQLQSLDLQMNKLEWLSRESFQGLGTSLQQIALGNNRLRNLRSDLEPLFTSVRDTISLSGNSMFLCDCNLQWLPQFITTHTTPEVELQQVQCQNQSNTTLINADFSSTQCQDICTLGYHSCSDQATCAVQGNSTQCTCLEGYTGDGIMCEQPRLCDSIMCDENAICEDDPTPRCTCRPGFTGNGYSCISLEQCVQRCSASNSSLHCIVNIDNERIDCGSKVVQQLQEALLLVSVNSSLDPGLTMFSSSLVTVARNISAPGDVPAIVDLLTQSVEIFLRGNQFENSTFSNLIEVGSELLHTRNQPLWNEVDATSVSDHVTDLFISIESLGEGLFLSSDGDNLITSENIALLVATPDCNQKNNITISSSLLKTPVAGGDSSLQLPFTVFSGEFECMEVGVIAVVYNGVGPLLNLDNELIPNCTSTPAPLVHGQCQWSTRKSFCPSYQVNSLIISAEAVRRINESIDLLNTTSLPDPIIVTLHHENVTLTNPQCSFLTDEQTRMDGSWLSDGCSLVTAASSDNVTVCECYHLTSFAILMSPTGPRTSTLALQIVSKVGLCVSIICLIITIILLFGLKLDTQLHHVHRQLALALCLAQLVFLIGVDRTLVPSPDAVCTAIAAFLHYLFLCTFAWQLVEGVHLYLFVVRVFFNKKIVWLYYPLAWGVPLIVVAITMGVRFCDYGSENFCWITNENGANWAFHGPVIAVLLVNIIIMVVVTSIIIRSSRKGSQDNFLLCTLLHASFVLAPILGITWVLGFFVVGDTTIAQIIEWLFCIFTALQGVMIFLMHCVLNRDVRKAFLKKIGCHEAAHKQQSLTIRRSSTVQTMNNINAAFKRKLSISGLRRNSVGDITAFNLDRSQSFTVARPQGDQSRVTGTNPLVMIEEEGDSLPNSLTSTPMLVKSEVTPEQNDGDAMASMNSSTQLSKNRNRINLL